MQDQTRVQHDTLLRKKKYHQMLSVLIKSIPVENYRLEIPGCGYFLIDVVKKI